MNDRTCRSPSHQDFSAFWQAYPKKVGKADAAKAFAKLKVNNALLDLMLAGIEVQAKTEAWTKKAGMFIPHPATWLNGRRWKTTRAVPGRSR